MYDRYSILNQISIFGGLYKNLLDRKKRNTIDQYTTVDLSSFIDLSNLEYIIHTVDFFEDISDISQKYYSSPEFGWLILYSNKIGSELEVDTGKILKIYFPIQELLNRLR